MEAISKQLWVKEKEEEEEEEERDSTKQIQI